MAPQTGYQRPPLVTAADISPRGGFTTLGVTSPAYSLMLEQARAVGDAPVATAAGPAFLGAPAFGVGVALLLVFAWYLDRRVLK